MPLIVKRPAPPESQPAPPPMPPINLASEKPDEDPEQETA